jgi:hypothetical protein
MEHVVIFSYMSMQLQTALCYSYDVIFITLTYSMDQSPS